MSDFSIEKLSTPTQSLKISCGELHVATFEYITNAALKTPGGYLVILRYPYDYQEYWRLLPHSAEFDRKKFLLWYRGYVETLTTALIGHFDFRPITVDDYPWQPFSEGYSLLCNQNPVGCLLDNRQYIAVVRQRA
jgi:hypothetical protein